MKRFRCVFGLLVLAVVASACTGSVDISFGGETPAEAAVDLIEGNEMAARIGIASVSDAECDDPLDEEIGTIFMCTAQSDGQTINFEVALEEDDRIFASPTNVVDPAGLSRLEDAAVQGLNNENDFGLPEGALECGDSGVILNAENQLICALTDPDTGVMFDTLVTVTDVETGQFTVVVVGEAAE